jgi:uncharacterized coiled-coil protein SlyX
MARLTLETVKQATDSLQNQGKKPSNRNIINWLGYGSFSTLKKLREHHPEVFYCTDTLNVAKYDTHKGGASLEARVARLEITVHKLIQVKATSSPELESLQRQVQELTEDLQEMYQLWRNATQPVLEPNAPVSQDEVKETTIPLVITEKPTVESSELPNPKQTQAFVSWAQWQKEQHNGSWKPVVEWLNQHQIVMLKGQPWTPKSLSDFIRKRKLQLSRVKSQT